MRPPPMHAPASEKPCPRRTTATYRPDASALPSTVSPPLPRDGLPAVQARKVKVGKGKEKQRGEHSLNTYPFPINRHELGRKGRDNTGHRSERDSNITSLQVVSELARGRSIGTQKLCKKTIFLPLRHFSPIFHSYKKGLETFE